MRHWYWLMPRAQDIAVIILMGTVEFAAIALLIYLAFRG